MGAEYMGSPDPAEPRVTDTVFAALASILSVLLAIPKYAQLRTETLHILDQAVKILAAEEWVFTEMEAAAMRNKFRNEVSASLDGVIKDLGSDPKTKTTARDLKASLINLT